MLSLANKTKTKTKAKGIKFMWLAASKTKLVRSRRFFYLF